MKGTWIICGFAAALSLVMVSTEAFAVAGKPSATPEPGSIDATQQALDSAVARFSNNDIAGSGPALDAVIASPAFDGLPSRSRYRALLLGGLSALNNGDKAHAHELLVRATDMPQSGGSDWHERLNVAFMLDDEADSLRSLTVIAQRWPQSLDQINYQAVMQIAQSDYADSHDELHFELLKALFDAGWTVEGALEPSWQWRDLVVGWIKRKSPDRALAVARRIDDIDVLIELRADLRFAALRKAAPERFDINQAQAESVKLYTIEAERRPHEMSWKVDLVNVLLRGGQYQDVLDISDAIIGEVKAAASSASSTSPYTDTDDKLIWVMNSRARALQALGRWDEAVLQLERAARRPENGRPNINQAINLAQLLCKLGRPEPALGVISEIENVSKYGLMQMYWIRLASAMQTGDVSAQETALAYMSEHRAESLYLYQSALVIAGHNDDAAQLLIQRLGDPDERSEALRQIQTYRKEPQPELATKWLEQSRQLLNRNDVLAAVKAVGTIESFEVAAAPG
ncbi:MAG: hypothetical protein JWQ90_5169 [Hydrocarboniphaga sp.]|uniref:hypothetical protein n=1 Tax=Hydrocarboniphaga sp. TaxID=2033016 RepID=UPI00260A2E14|nr:hypothetical protein [Hydrocarboniphaga sp.]MDB5972719.1 hypothetical protein [Hydrocarboniphaga sp.]